MQTDRGTAYRRWLVGGALLLGLALTATGMAMAQQTPPAPAQPPGGERFLTPEDRAAMSDIFWRRAKERLGLTDQQVTDIRTLLQNRRAAVRGDVQALAAARRQLRQLMGQPTADPAAIQSAAAQVKSLQDKLFDQRLQTQLDIRSKLTPAQLTKWIELREGMGHRRMGHGRWMRGHGFGGGFM